MKLALLGGLILVAILLSGCTSSSPTGQASLSDKPAKTDCPNECCIGSLNYYDKICDLDFECKNSTCVAKETEQTQKKDKEDQCEDVQCSDSNPCTGDFCQEGECKHPTVTDGTACGENKQCKTGICKEIPQPDQVPPVDTSGSSWSDSLEDLRDALEESSENLDNLNKLKECAKKCSAEYSNIPAVYSEFYYVCYEIYYYAGMEEMESFMNDC